jgi:hypothetical protein
MFAKLMLTKQVLPRQNSDNAYEVNFPTESSDNAYEVNFPTESS